MSAMASQITGVTVFYERKSPVTNEFPAPRASNAEIFQFDDLIISDMLRAKPFR